MNLNEIVREMDKVLELDDLLNGVYQGFESDVIENFTKPINPIGKTKLHSATLTHDDKLLLVLLDENETVFYGLIAPDKFKELDTVGNRLYNFIRLTKEKRVVLSYIYMELELYVAPKLIGDDIESVDILSYDKKEGTTIEIGATLNDSYADEDLTLYYRTIDLKDFFE